MDLRRRAVLGAFMFNPAWMLASPTKGFQSRTIWASVPDVFQEIWPTAQNSSAVALIANSLTREGYLYKPGVVRTRNNFRTLPQQPIEYDSPIFAPTESGVLYLLTSGEFDLDHLINADGKPRGWRRFQYDATARKVEEEFRLFIRFQDEECRRLIHKADRRAHSKARRRNATKQRTI